MGNIPVWANELKESQKKKNKIYKNKKIGDETENAKKWWIAGYLF